MLHLMFSGKKKKKKVDFDFGLVILVRLLCFEEEIRLNLSFFSEIG